mmetsp:Transcript_1824/g.3261  ORF Transcript_1824/g.3261 Transcript_1824/m.3261 type:complete len:750 (-) Transcript_1824:113-2362(-)
MDEGMRAEDMEFGRERSAGLGQEMSEISSGTNQEYDTSSSNPFGGSVEGQQEIDSGNSAASEHLLQHDQEIGMNTLDAWRSFGLDARRSDLDESALQIANKQEASSRARKALADSTRSFKRNSTAAPEVHKAFTALLKEYQVEIDALTSRSKFAEGAFLALYRALYELPDPVTELEAALHRELRLMEIEEQRSRAENERQRLREQLLAAEQAQGQLDAHHEELERQREQLMTQFEAQLVRLQNEWLQQQEAAKAESEHRETELKSQLSAAQEESRELRRTVESQKIQLFDAKGRIEEAKSMKMGELELAEEDLMSARAEITSLRHRVAHLEAASNQSNDASDDRFHDRENRDRERVELASKDIEIAQLRERIQRLTAASGSLNSSSNEAEQVQRLIAEKDAKITQLSTEIAKLPSLREYESMKSEFDAMQSIQFEITQHNQSDGNRTDELSLERRLIERVKVLEGRLTRVRRELSEKERDFNAFEQRERALEDAVSDQKALISRLESSIESMTSESTASNPMGVRASRLMTDRITPDDDWGFDDVEARSGTSGSVGKSGGSEPSMLQIITGQRNRFRVRCRELEDEQQRLQERVLKLTSEIDILKSDNVQLYEKMRYIRQYYSSSSSNQASARAAVRSGVSPEIDIDDGIGSKYKGAYEASVNPFTAFNRKERSRRVNEMNFAEWLTLQAGERLLGSRFLRLFTFSYMLALHLFIFLILSTVRNTCTSPILNISPHTLQPQTDSNPIPN